LCKPCNYFFSVNKLGKKIDDYYVTKALQLYLEGLSFREIERIIGVSHVSISNWVKEFKIKKPENSNYHPTYKIFNHLELVEFLKNKEILSGAGMIITELGDKFMLIKWERFKD
jgi:transposase